MSHPNTVAHSSGAVVCPDEASARRHRDRATWWANEPNATFPAGRIEGPVEIDGLGTVHVARMYIAPLDAGGRPTPQYWSGRRWTR